MRKKRPMDISLFVTPSITKAFVNGFVSAFGVDIISNISDIGIELILLQLND